MVTEAVGDQRAVSVDDLPELKTMLAPASALAPKDTPSEFTNITAEGLHALIDKALSNDMNLWVVLEAIERGLVGEAYKRHGSIRGVADALGVTRVKAKFLLEQP